MSVLLEILTYKTENKPMKKLTLLIFVALSTQALYGADSQTAATLPGTYTAKALVGCVLTPIRISIQKTDYQELFSLRRTLVN